MLSNRCWCVQSRTGVVARRYKPVLAWVRRKPVLPRGVDHQQATGAMLYSFSYRPLVDRADPPQWDSSRSHWAGIPSWPLTVSLTEHARPLSIITHPATPPPPTLNEPNAPPPPPFSHPISLFCEISGTSFCIGVPGRRPRLSCLVRRPHCSSSKHEICSGLALTSAVSAVSAAGLPCSSAS